MSSCLAAAALPCVIFLLFILRHFAGRRVSRRPPGPRPLPVIGNLHILGKLPHRSLYELSKQYGPIMFVRLGSVPAVVISSPETVKLFLKTHGHVFADRPKTQAFQEMFSREGLAFAEHGPHWQNIRKICQIQLLSSARTESYGPMRKEAVGKLVETIKVAAAAGEVVDISAMVRELIEDVSCTMILGCSPKDMLDLKPLIQEILYLSGTSNFADYVPFLRRFDLQGLSRRMKAARACMDKALDNIIDKHINAVNGSGNGRDYVDVLLSTMSDEPSSDNALSRKNVKALLFDLVAASYESAGVAIEWALSELVRNPKTMLCLQEEIIKSGVRMDRMVEEADLENLSYLDMVVKESMRLHPVGAFLIPRASSEDVTINGFEITKGTHLMVNTWALGRDPSIWGEGAEEFRPERFVNSDTEFMGRDFKLIPFGAGRRVCPGMSLGLREVHFVVAQLVHCFKWELPQSVGLATNLDMMEGTGLSNGRATNLLLRPTYRLLV